jgi:hypothetical protein
MVRTVVRAWIRLLPVRWDQRATGAIKENVGPQVRRGVTVQHCRAKGARRVTGASRGRPFLARAVSVAKQGTTVRKGHVAETVTQVQQGRKVPQGATAKMALIVRCLVPQVPKVNAAPKVTASEVNVAPAVKMDVMV